MQTISSSELKNKLDANEDVALIDVREPDEHAAYNIGGVLLPLGNILSMQTDSIDDLRNKEVVCYCRSGNRSMQACMMLETFGFTNVKNLVGGMMEWEAKYK
ncbi:MAG: rhodanese-like domain-containing protein [Ferruginibacter sp.]